MHLPWNADEKRVQRALTGDRHAASRLVDDHYPGLLRFLLHLTGNSDEAEEIVQETFVRAWRRLDTYSARSSFRTWIHRIAYREFLARRTVRTEDRLDDNAGGDDFSESLLEALDVERAVLALPFDLRLTFLLFHVEGLSVLEVAHVLDIPKGTVLSRNAAARARLARSLDPLHLRREESRPKSPALNIREGSNPYEITPTAL